MDNEETEKEYTEPVEITVDDDTFMWSPDSERLIPKSGDTVLDTIEALDDFIYYSSPDRLVIPVSPVGPFLPANTSSLYTVVWATQTLFADRNISYLGDVPTLYDMGLDEESNFDEDGNEIVR